MTYQIPIVKDKLSENNYNKLIEEIEMLDTAGEQFDSAAVLEGGDSCILRQRNEQLRRSAFA